MFRSVADFDKAVYDTLIRLRDGENLNSKPSTLEQADYSDILAFIIDNRLALSAPPPPHSRNRWVSFTVYEVDPSARIARDGLLFIESYKP